MNDPDLGKARQNVLAVINGSIKFRKGVEFLLCKTVLIAFFIELN